ncbi:MAG: RHS repeat-associated core domain-containing protein, partial [Akkermansia sp.]|nr:RHS repeat-associated core domain-containing protein [Akkermansia sp.]
VRTATGTWSVTYNAENRPVIFQKTTDSVTTRITCTYDYMGRRATKKVEEITTDAEGNETTIVISNHRFIYRGYLQIACCDLTRTHHPCLWLITWDPTQPVATRPLAIQKDGTWFCYGWDLTKNICEIFGQNGYIRSTYAYTPFGAVTTSGDITQPIQWSSEYYDRELALVYYNYRHYNPTDGRWINRDPIAEQGGWNLYGMMHNCVNLYTDFLGLRERKSDKLNDLINDECNENAFRIQIKLNEDLKEFGAKIGIYNFSFFAGVQSKECKGCCRLSGKKGVNQTYSVGINLSGEFGSKEEDFGIIKLRLGWYGRLSISGNISRTYNSCKNRESGNLCGYGSGEVGLIASVAGRKIDVEVGARGGVQVQLAVCFNRDFITKKVKLRSRLCGAIKGRAWAKIKIWPFENSWIRYEHEWSKTKCTNWWDIM